MREKNLLLSTLASLEEEILYYNRWLFENPELPRQEHQAARELCSWLEGHGFIVEKGVAGLPTAFLATREHGRGGPQVGFLAEYDALPGVGHGCGHNLIAASCGGGGVALAHWLEKTQTPGKVIVYGCPDEEFDGGKVPMVEQGLFPDTLDAALHIHAGTLTELWGWSPSATSMLMKFYGKAAHTASEPEEGLNALHALLIAFHALDALRHHVKEGTRMPATITDGGGAPNAVPAYAEGRIHLTTTDQAYLLDLIKRVKNCGKGGALAAGVHVEFWEGPIYDNMVLNQTLAKSMARHFRDVDLDILPPKRGNGSTDVGNVSVVTPTCAATIAIADQETKMHSREFAQATVSLRGEKAVLDAARIMALTAAEIMQDENLRRESKREFKHLKANNNL